jgi:glycosyltransferase involved in cell wall biosynthesis
MKIAFVDNLQVGGGLSRFSLLLCKSLIEKDETILIDYFIHSQNLKLVPELLSIKNVNVIVLKSTLPFGFLEKVIFKLKTILGFKQSENPVIVEIEKLVDQKYDLAYFPSAHMMERPSLKIPIVGTLHDFNWKYFFGRQIFSNSFVKKMDNEIVKWMNGGYNVCSAQDVVDEARKLYPGMENYPEVVHIAPVIFNSKISEKRSNEILKDLNINYPYIIFPGNFFPHKNHLNLFTAFHLLKQKESFKHLKLLLTGMNSDQVPWAKAEYRGIRLISEIKGNEDFDIMGLGYQTNECIDVLIANAQLLVSPSIYEAICTPAMDAWNFGVPTAISDIPPFREHEKAWGIHSVFFDPMNPKDIAEKIENALVDYETTKANGKLSREKMLNYGWEKVTEGYLAIFKKAIVKK